MTNTLFRYRRIHTTSWMHAGSKQEHLLDYVVTDQQMRAHVLDTRTYRGADLPSDHRLVISKMRLPFFHSGASGGPCPLLVPVGPLHPVQVSQRKMEAPLGCVSLGRSRSAVDPEVHIIVLGPLPGQAEWPQQRPQQRPQQQPVVRVSVRARGVQRRPLALVLVAAQRVTGIQWRLSASGLNSDLVNTLHVSPGSVWLCTGRCLRHRSSREVPAEPGADDDTDDDATADDDDP
ncbi:uncharacterized protein LOC144955302 isoform X1 [Lampetra fluviatilis]